MDDPCQPCTAAKPLTVNNFNLTMVVNIGMRFKLISRDRFMSMRISMELPALYYPWYYIFNISKCTATLLPGMASIPSAAFVFDQDLAS